MALTLAFYRGGLERITPTGWAARAADEVLLTEFGTGWAFDITHVSLTSLVLGTTELTGAAGYARQPLVPSTPSYSSGRWSLPAAAVTWTSLGTAEQVAAVVGFEAGVDDANSVPLWALYDPVGPAAIATLDGTDVTLTLDLGVTVP